MIYGPPRRIRRIDLAILAVMALGTLALAIVLANDEPEQMWAEESLRR